MEVCYFKRESICPDRCIFRQARILAPDLIDENIKFALESGFSNIEGFDEALAAVILNPDAGFVGIDPVYAHIITAELIELYGKDGTNSCALLQNLPLKDLPRRRATGN